ncbi:MAG: RecX family transcriptional regulator [Bacillaceae bacterium]|nr:RecX family transcriptional regulator [Bacillaceae bacterium]
MSDRESVITLIERQKKNPKRYSIYVNDEYAFSVHEDVLIKYRLLKGRLMTPAEIEEISVEEERNRARQKAIRYLGFKPRTRQELLRHLIQKGFEPSIAEETVDWCEEQGYVNDRQYAEQWVRERMHLRPRGRYLLKQELIQRGIDADTAERAVHRLSEEAEETAARQLIEKKYTRGEFDDRGQFMRKAGGFLQRKGFEHALIMRVLREMESDYISKSTEKD